jgi:hypothetical protein
METVHPAVAICGVASSDVMSFEIADATSPLHETATRPNSSTPTEGSFWQEPPAHFGGKASCGREKGWLGAAWLEIPPFPPAPSK